MNEFIGRAEHDDVVRHLTTKVDRLNDSNLDLLDRLRAVEGGIMANNFSIRLLGRLLQPLLSSEQRDLLDLESKAGVVDSALEVAEQREPNDGMEWRARLRQRAAAASAELGRDVSPAEQSRREWSDPLAVGDGADKPPAFL